MKTQREELLQVIRDSALHMTAEEIYLACRQKNVHVSMATVYRNLGILVESRKLRRVPVPGRPDCFDVTVARHSHKVCDRCGTVSDTNIGDLKSELETRAGFSITDYDLCLHYICPDCQQAEE